KLVGTSAAAAAGDGSLTDCRIVVSELFAFPDSSCRANPNGGVDDFEPAVRPAGMVDESRDVAADRGITAPCAVDAEYPDASVGEVTGFARLAPAVANELARVVNDAPVLGDRLEREDAEPMHLGTPTDELWKSPRRRHAGIVTLCRPEQTAV